MVTGLLLRRERSKRRTNIALFDVLDLYGLHTSLAKQPLGQLVTVTPLPCTSDDSVLPDAFWLCDMELTVNKLLPLSVVKSPSSPESTTDLVNLQKLHTFRGACALQRQQIDGPMTHD